MGERISGLAPAFTHERFAFLVARLAAGWQEFEYGMFFGVTVVRPGADLSGAAKTAHTDIVGWIQGADFFAG